MRHGSLFSGIGGFDLAAEWAGWENVFHCEINPFGQKVLQYYFPKADMIEDITKADFKKYEGTVDIISGGFPCQDASIAKQHGEGQRGLNGGRTGLWSEFERAIKDVKPKYIVIENVKNILRTNDGRDFRTIISSLDGMGYNAEWRVCRASEVGGCHHRARMYMVAYTNGNGLVKRESFFSGIYEEIPQVRRNIAGTTASVGISWDDEPIVSWVDDGIPERLDKITFPKWRRETLKAYGNAIVPQVAYKIFKAINEIENK